MGGAFIAVVVMVALVSFGIGVSANPNAANGTTPAASNSSTNNSSMGTGSMSTPAPANVPNATQSYGSQLLPYTVDPDGAKSCQR